MDLPLLFLCRTGRCFRDGTAQVEIGVKAEKRTPLELDDLSEGGAMAQGGSVFGQHVVGPGRLWGRHIRVVSLRREAIGTTLSDQTPSRNKGALVVSITSRFCNPCTPPQNHTLKSIRIDVHQYVYPCPTVVRSRDHAFVECTRHQAPHREWK